jgi:NAD(P)-dependent dehydrogenase (short-subunit alcohol dehydrogenase family)
MVRNGSTKCALVTGSSRGIGRGIALKLAEQGTNVAVHYYQHEAAALDTLARVRMWLGRVRRPGGCLAS